MVSYRVYAVGNDGHIVRIQVIEAADDNEAVERAKELKNGGLGVELWDQARLIARIKWDDAS